MNRTYAFAMKLQDLFSPTMLRISATYEQRVGFMGRMWAKFTGMLNNTSQTVASLRSKLSGLGSGFRVKLDSSDIDQADRKANGLFNRLKNFAGKSTLLAGMVGGGIGGMASGAIDMVVQQMDAIRDKTIGAAQRSNTTMFTLSELMGPAATKSLIKGIDAYAPERRDQLLTSAQKLSGAGVSGSQLMDTLKYLNNISALTGKSVEELAEIQGVIKATGYVQGDEINRFKERGINLNPYLAKILGVRENEIAKEQSKGKITYGVFDKAMQAYAGKGSKYENVYERKMTGTTEGKEQLVSGRFDTMMRGFGDKLLPIKDSILDMLADTASGTGPIVAIFERLWQIIKPVWDGIVGLMQSFGLLNEQGSISQWVFDTLKVSWDLLSTVFKIAGGIIWGVSKAIGWLVNSPLGMLIAGIYLVVKAWGVLNAVMALNPFSWVVLGIAAVVTGITYAWDKFDGFREAMLRSWEVIKSIFSNIGGFFNALFSGNIKAAIAIAGGALIEGLTNGRNSVQQDRLDRLNERRAGRRAREGKGGMQEPGSFSASASGGLADAAGLSSTVANAKSSTVNINIKSLIEKSEITVMEYKESLDDLESKLIETMLRVANSGANVVTS